VARTESIASYDLADLVLSLFAVSAVFAALGWIASL